MLFINVILIIECFNKQNTCMCFENEMMWLKKKIIEKEKQRGFQNFTHQRQSLSILTETVFNIDKSGSCWEHASLRVCIYCI